MLKLFGTLQVKGGDDSLDNVILTGSILFAVLFVELDDELDVEDA